MREFLDIGDLVVAEIKSVSKVDFNITLHLRHEKFGRLSDGALIAVNSSLIRRMTKHIVEYNGLELIFAVNGFIWIKSLQPDSSAFERIAKLRNLIRILDDAMVPVHPALLFELFEQSTEVRAKDLLLAENREKISTRVKNSILSKNN